jgi:NCS1 family nucleobase:cation symporter-1
VISASASKPLYGEYIWDPLTLASKWTSPAGRLGAFYCDLAWCIAQIGVNVSANVISVLNDLTSLIPKYINLRRAALLATLITSWVMVPWKIITGASSLISFMDSLGILVAPIIGISIADYWIVKRRRVEIATLYVPGGRYHYRAGVNWRAMLAMLCSVGPTMPGLAKNISPSLDIGGAQYIADLIWYYGFIVSFLVYLAVSTIWPAEETLVEKFLLSEDIDLEVQVVEEFPAKLEKN